jgi:hypothetical protein
MQLFVGIDPLPIKIYQTEVATVVADNYSIGVEHRHYLEDEVFP